MGTSKNYTQEYEKAKKAYLNGNYQEAATIIDDLVEDIPEDPSILLLRGNIYGYGFHQYDFAKQQYSSVLEITEQPELVKYALDAIKEIKQLQEETLSGAWSATPTKTYDQQPETDEIDWDENLDFATIDWDDSQNHEEYSEEPTLQQKSPIKESFRVSPPENYPKNPPVLEPPNESLYIEKGEDEDETALDWEKMPQTTDNQYPFSINNGYDEDYQFDLSEEGEAPTFVVSSELQEMLSISEEDLFDSGVGINQDDYSSELSPIESQTNNLRKKPSSIGRNNIAENNSQASENFNLFEDQGIENTANFENSQSLPDSGFFTEQTGNLSSTLDMKTDISRFSQSEFLPPSEVKENSIGTVSGISGIVGKPEVEVNPGTFGFFNNASLRKKQFITASIVGIVSSLAVAGVSLLPSPGKANTKTNIFTNQEIVLTVMAGATSFLTTFLLGGVAAAHSKRCTLELQNKFDEVYQGNFNAKATVYSEDEFGQMATSFNLMANKIASVTSEAQRRIEERERAREDLERQVIHLLDDVEGAARGDLTVRAEVTANVLGAIADAFNLTIENLREIVRQVKEAAQQVHQGSTDSELFARNQSSDALRMAEELAVTLNSVQMLTESIQRVADSAREAETVARSSSVTALRGGEAVEHTVEGILQIRETVSETTRKVKRLAEASQEISKIVALISNISTRTNMLALNASIHAARAGEAGRGFAIVADEVRQLADRSAKSLKDIEQIVLQIQTETSQVMTSMEEGLQLVFNVTERAEQAKGALDDIIQVSNRIDALVRSITADTVEQRENSRAVAQVMQSVELTAQETSQESQRVAGSLQNLVGIARDLLASVERFRTDMSETK